MKIARGGHRGAGRKRGEKKKVDYRRENKESYEYLHGVQKRRRLN